MTDIVDRLGRDLMEISYDDIEEMVREAAREIELLREELADVREQVAILRTTETTEVERLQALADATMVSLQQTLEERERLQAALQVVVANFGTGIAYNVARRALEPKP